MTHLVDALITGVGIGVIGLLALLALNALAEGASDALRIDPRIGWVFGVMALLAVGVLWKWWVAIAGIALVLALASMRLASGPRPNQVEP